MSLLLLVTFSLVYDMYLLALLTYYVAPTNSQHFNTTIDEEEYTNSDFRYQRALGHIFNVIPKREWLSADIFKTKDKLWGHHSTFRGTILLTEWIKLDVAFFMMMVMITYPPFSRTKNSEMTFGTCVHSKCPKVSSLWHREKKLYAKNFKGH